MLLLHFMWTNSMNNYYKGLLAEKISILYLLFKGHKIIKTRYKTRLGEIDIISRKNKEIHFIEVKSRKNQNAFLDVISRKQQNRIKNAALLFLQKNKRFSCHNVTFDVVFIKYPLYFKYIYNSF